MMVRMDEEQMNLVARNVPVARAIAPNEFRHAMRHLVGGVSVITAGRGGDISGMTVTSASSLAVDPPTLIVAINRDASSLPLLRRYGAFGVNILSGEQVDLAERFAGKGGLKGTERFAGSVWATGPSGVPLLRDALVAVGCEVEEIIERHSHAIVIGHVVHLASTEGPAALAYWRGKYLAVEQDRDAPRLAEVSLPTSRALWD
jgi:flavin reductase (DIM6/NTAB) family NADH-FMN oxidoreductase RutF